MVNGLPSEPDVELSKYKISAQLRQILTANKNNLQRYHECALCYCCEARLRARNNSMDSTACALAHKRFGPTASDWREGLFFEDLLACEPITTIIRAFLKSTSEKCAEMHLRIEELRAHSSQFDKQVKDAIKLVQAIFRLESEQSENASKRAVPRSV